MARRLGEGAARDLARVFDRGAAGSLSDGELLGRFLRGPGRAGEEAFAALVERHGPTVLTVCRRMLADAHEAEDAFQATFLVLAKKAPAISGRERVGNWLYGVALRVAREARRRADRRARRERLLGDDDAGVVDASASVGSDAAVEELRAAVVEELSRLPDRYRGPLLLCDLEGRSRREAAERLGVPEGTVSSRLARGRDLLKARMVRRGLAPAAVLGTAGSAASAAGSGGASAFVSRGLVEATTRAAVAWGSGGVRGAIAAGSVSAAASSMAGGVIMSLKLVSVLKVSAAGVLAVAAIGGGIALATVRPGHGPGPGVGGPVVPVAGPVRADAPEQEEESGPRIGVVRDIEGNPVEGATVVLGIVRQGAPVRRLVLSTDEEGKYELPETPMPFGVYAAGYREGFAGDTSPSHFSKERSAESLDLRLSPVEAFEGMLVDSDGSPMAGAEVRVETIVSGPFPGARIGKFSSVGYAHTNVDWTIIQGTPVAPAFSATTGEDGSFSLPLRRQAAGLRLAIRSADGRSLQPDVEGGEGRALLWREGLVPVEPGERATITVRAAARVVGRVVSRGPEVDISTLRVGITGADRYGIAKNQSGPSRVDASGYFSIEGLEPDTVRLYLSGRPEDAAWAWRGPAEPVELDWDRTSEAVIEIVPGVRAEGRVVDDEGEPVAGAVVRWMGPDFPEDVTAVVRGLDTDEEGRYRCRLAPGTHQGSLFELPEGYVRLELEPPLEESSEFGAGSIETATVPEDAEAFELPTIRVGRAETLHGRVVDEQGDPAAGAEVVGVIQRVSLRQENSLVNATMAPAGVADEEGRFRLSGQYHQAMPDRPAQVVVRFENQIFRLIVAPSADGEVTLELPEEGIPIELPGS